MQKGFLEPYFVIFQYWMISLDFGYLKLSP
jgi:hypothetical protein